MKTNTRFLRATLLALVLAVAAPATAAEAAGPDVRAAIESHSLEDLEGNAVRPALEEGTVVLVNFWAEWCRPCRRELPILDGWQEQWQDRGVEFVCVSIGSQPGKARRMADDLELSLPLYHDGPDGLARTLDLPALPITYVLDAQGRLSLVSTGSDEKALGRLHDHVEKLLTQRDSRQAGLRTSVEETR